MSLQSLNSVGINHFSTLPPTHQLLIFGELDDVSLLTCRKVCKFWNQQITNAISLWRKICQDNYPDSLAESNGNPSASLVRTQLAIENNIRKYQA